MTATAATARRRALNPWLLISAAWIAPALLAALDAWAQRRLGRGAPPITLRELLWQGGDWLLYGAVTPLVLFFARRLPLRRGLLRRNLPLHFVAALFLCGVWAGLGSLLRWAILGAAPTSLFLERWWFTTLPFGVAVYFAVVGVEHAMHFFAEARDRELQSAQLTAQLANARLGALQMQLQPHFLFNSLNAVAVSLRDADNRTALRMLELLSDLLRQILQSGAEPEVTLAEEMRFVEEYLAIEQIRFSDRLRIVTDVGAGLHAALVPRFLLQPIVENAIRHGIARRPEAGVVRVTAAVDRDDLVLIVDDDGPGPPPSVREGVGLSNTRARLATLYGGRAQLTLSEQRPGARVTVRVPWHTAAAPVPPNA